MKTFIKVTLIAAVATVAGYGIYMNQNTTDMSDLMLENIEALAEGEVIVGPWYCAGSGYCFDVESQMAFEGTKYGR